MSRDLPLLREFALCICCIVIVLQLSWLIDYSSNSFTFVCNFSSWLWVYVCVFCIAWLWLERGSEEMARLRELLLVSFVEDAQ